MLVLIDSLIPSIFFFKHKEILVSEVESYLELRLYVQSIMYKLFVVRSNEWKTLLEIRKCGLHYFIKQYITLTLFSLITCKEVQICIFPPWMILFSGSTRGVREGANVPLNFFLAPPFAPPKSRKMDKLSVKSIKKWAFCCQSGQNRWHFEGLASLKWSKPTTFWVLLPPLEKWLASHFQKKKKNWCWCHHW